MNRNLGPVYEWFWGLGGGEGPVQGANSACEGRQGGRFEPVWGFFKMWHVGVGDYELGVLLLVRAGPYDGWLGVPRLLSSDVVARDCLANIVCNILQHL